MVQIILQPAKKNIAGKFGQNPGLAPICPGGNHGVRFEIIYDKKTFLAWARLGAGLVC